MRIPTCAAKRTTFGLLVLSLLTSPCILAQTSDDEESLIPVSVPASKRYTCFPDAAVPFGIGERIDFRVAFGPVPAGKAQLAIMDTLTVNGQLCYHAVSSARSAKAFDVVFKVRDSIETWFDSDSIYTHRFRKRLREGPFHDEKIVDYVLADSLVRWSDDGRTRTPIHVEPRVQDVLSAGYFARLLPMAVGDTFYVRTHDVKKTYDLMVIVHGRETVDTPAGSFSCLKVEPILSSGSLFKKEKGARVYVWVTDDERRIPVKMTTRVSFGTITAQIEKYTPPQPR